MAASYQSFLKKNIDLSPFGILRGGENSSYFCTPKGARIIGRTGVDGVHYCFIRGFGEMVFAVSPMSTPGNYVHPVAENFEDFLRLLLSCGSEAALEQAYAWDKQQFDVFLQENPVTEEQRRGMERIAGQMKLAPMDVPFSYIKKLQEEFDDSKIPYTEDFYDPDMNADAGPEIPEWKVFFDGDFLGRRGRERAGKEIRVGREFSWGGSQWQIPSVYSCAGGLVVDFCIRTPEGRIRNFMDKWKLTADNADGRNFTRDEQMQMNAENPMQFEFGAETIVNGTVLQASHGCSTCWNPYAFEAAFSVQPDIRAAMEHYGLDAADGWTIWRHCFPWKTKRRPEIKTLGFTLKQNRIPIPGPHFHVERPGDSFSFVHPATGQNHVLTVQEYEQKEAPEDRFRSERMPEMEFPSHYTSMCYTVAPELPDEAFTVEDCAESDRPKEKKRDPMEPKARNGAVCIAIIGGADGPTEIAFGQNGQGKLRAAAPALHFEPVDEVEWRIVFYEKWLEDMAVEADEVCAVKKRNG